MQKVKSKFERKNLTRILFFYMIFSIKIRTYLKKAFSKISYMFRDIEKNIMCKFLFFKGFCQFLIEFSIFLKMVYSAEISINVDSIFAPRVLEGSQCFGVKCGNLSELFWKVLKKGLFKTISWKKGSSIPFLLSLFRHLREENRKF